MSVVHKVIAIEQKSTHTFKLLLERRDFRFRAGQCFNLGIPGSGVNREYSSYSSETAQELAFLIREVESGCVSPELHQLKSSDLVEVDGAYGEFCIKNPNSNNKYCFIGSGTGIAPFHCFVKSFPQIDYQIIHGVRYKDEQYDRKDYGQRYFSCLTKDEGGDFKGRVTDYLKTQKLDPNKLYYLCGNRAMINEVYDLLREQNVSGSHIFTETFF